MSGSGRPQDLGGVIVAEPEILGAILRRARRGRRLSLTAIAAKLRLSASRLSELERGDPGLTVATLRELAAALDIDGRDLLADLDRATAEIRQRGGVVVPRACAASRAWRADAVVARLGEVA